MNRGLRRIHCQPEETTMTQPMNTYVILRRRAWPSAAELGIAAARSTEVGNQMPEDVRWIRSYVLAEGGMEVGTVCIYEATSEVAIQEHAARANLPVDEIIPVADTVVVRADPGSVAKAA
jgi:hypothetical protein